MARFGAQVVFAVTCLHLGIAQALRAAPPQQTAYVASKICPDHDRGVYTDTGRQPWNVYCRQSLDGSALSTGRAKGMCLTSHVEELADEESRFRRLRQPMQYSNRLSRRWIWLSHEPCLASSRCKYGNLLVLWRHGQPIPDWHRERQGRLRPKDGGSDHACTGKSMFNPLEIMAHR